MKPSSTDRNSRSDGSGSRASTYDELCLKALNPFKLCFPLLASFSSHQGLSSSEPSSPVKAAKPFGSRVKMCCQKQTRRQRNDSSFRLYIMTLPNKVSALTMTPQHFSLEGSQEVEVGQVVQGDQDRKVLLIKIHSR